MEKAKHDTISNRTAELEGAWPILPAPPYRPLSEDEQEIMFLLFEVHNGNLSALARDPESKFHSREQLRYYRDVYGWVAKLGQIKAEKARQIVDRLGEAKIRAIERAMELLESRIVQIPIPTVGKIMELRKEPMYKEIVAAWQIIKTELGEPTNITKAETRTEVSIVEQEVNKLNQFLEDVKTTVATIEPVGKKDGPASM